VEPAVIAGLLAQVVLADAQSDFSSSAPVITAADAPRPAPAAMNGAAGRPKIVALEAMALTMPIISAARAVAGPTQKLEDAARHLVQHG
jgi:hypothetical protein